MAAVDGLERLLIVRRCAVARFSQALSRMGGRYAERVRAQIVARYTEPEPLSAQSRHAAVGSPKRGRPARTAIRRGAGVDVGSNDKTTPGTGSRKTGDTDLDALTERLRVDWESRRAKDEVTARELGRRIAAHVDAAMRQRRRMAETPPTEREWGGASEKQLATRRAALAEAAETARKNHARKRYTSAEALEVAVRQQCVAEYGGIMGAPYRDDDTYRLLFVSTVGGSALWEARARKIYTELRKAVTTARTFAYQMPNGVGDAAACALFTMRGVLPVLPPLTEPPFRNPPPTGRAAFVLATDRTIRVALKKTLTDRDLAVLSLLAGFCPRGTYKTLHKTCKTVAAVLEEEANCVARVRKKRAANPPT